ncbi:DUF1573 domain-containing protein [Bacteroides muris (ex Fokt et al. 2023)]|uniref:DUF1573 domain-containing protein n=1 Tax=Bacteroides muris (ex Fokt et al. 2023) TaxID=2937417 RepID=UPI002E2436BE
MEKKRVLDIVAEWQGKEVLFPDDMVFTLWGQDTLNNFVPRVDYTIVSYVDSVGCMSCKLQLSKWKSFIAELISISQNDVPVIFFFHPKNMEELIYRLEFDKYNFPVCVDIENKFDKLNNFPSDMSFQTFLLDKDNKVLAIGNPIHNPKVKELYLKIIQGEKIGSINESNVLNTMVDIDKTAASLGDFAWQEERKATFTLKNMGNKPLFISDVTTSCGCTSVDYSKEPVNPSDSLRLHVTYKADHPGYFSKMITVYCNADASPIRLKISGNAK